jgi:hypothetical protein
MTWGARCSRALGAIWERAALWVQTDRTYLRATPLRGGELGDRLVDSPGDLIADADLAKGPPAGSFELPVAVALAGI